MYNAPIENDVLWTMLEEGWTYDDFKRNVNECEQLHSLGKMHVRHIEKARIAVEYLESENFKREYELFAQIYEILHPYIEKEVLQDFGFSVEFNDEVEITLETNVEYELIGSDSNFKKLKGSYTDIVDGLKEHVDKYLKPFI